MANNALRNELKPIITSAEIEIVSHELSCWITIKFEIVKND
jgi:hypothetical protein